MQLQFEQDRRARYAYSSIHHANFIEGACSGNCPIITCGNAYPVAALLRGLGTTSGGGGLGDIGVPVAIMLGFVVVMLVVSRLVPDRGVLS